MECCIAIDDTCLDIIRLTEFDDFSVREIRMHLYLVYARLYV